MVNILLHSLTIAIHSIAIAMHNFSEVGPPSVNLVLVVIRLVLQVLISVHGHFGPPSDNHLVGVHHFGPLFGW